MYVQLCVFAPYIYIYSLSVQMHTQANSTSYFSSVRFCFKELEWDELSQLCAAQAQL